MCIYLCMKTIYEYIYIYTYIYISMPCEPNAVPSSHVW